MSGSAVTTYRLQEASLWIVVLGLKCLKLSFPSKPWCHSCHILAWWTRSNCTQCLRSLSFLRWLAFIFVTSEMAIDFTRCTPKILRVWVSCLNRSCQICSLPPMIFGWVPHIPSTCFHSKRWSCHKEKMVTFAVGKGNETHLQPQHLTTMEAMGWPCSLPLSEMAKSWSVEARGNSIQLQHFCHTDRYRYVKAINKTCVGSH